MMENEMTVGRLPTFKGVYKLTHRYNPVNKNGHGKRFLYNACIFKRFLDCKLSSSC